VPLENQQSLIHRDRDNQNHERRRPDNVNLKIALAYRSQVPKTRLRAHKLRNDCGLQR
jgi:hypothetical protein